MKLDEEYGLDRRIGFETDDEENQAERAYQNDDNDDTDSDIVLPSRNASIDLNSPSWPQTYRKSMDMYTSVTPPPSLSFLTGTSFKKISDSFLTSPYKRSHPTLPDSSFNKPLITATSLDNEEVPPSTLPSKLSTSSYSSLSFNELPSPQQCSYAQSVLNAINVLCGIGLLTTPYALKEGGWSSLLLLFVMGIICCYTGILLKQCLDSSPELKTYPDIGQAAFGVTGRILIAIILYMDLYSTCVEFLIMMSDNLSALFPDTHMDFAGFHLDSHQIFAITATLIIIPTVWLQDLSLLSYVSAGGIVTSVLLVLCLLWSGVIDKIGFHPSGTALNLAGLPVTVGLFGFCFGSHSVFPNIYSSMKQPSKFPSVLIISFVASVLIYAGVAICGFLMFGDSTESQYTLNMPKKFVASKIAAWTTVLCPFTKYALTITPVAFSIEELLPLAQQRSYSVSIIIRTVLVISTLVVALSVPYFESVTALIGSLLVMLVSIILPAACYLTILHGRLSKMQVAVCIFIVIAGVLCAIVGTYSAIASIADKMG
ncbi:amino acid transporter AVT1D-like [Cornus florida]|uniref:amino acid transporter AVT1D-like n=1 Tax=Cornus florida TaxID=4283 RepID=UPI00289F4C29|nr:amino acid transporter AVT1D-like [Cornus florida]